MIGQSTNHSFNKRLDFFLNSLLKGNRLSFLTLPVVMTTGFSEARVAQLGLSGSKIP